MQEARGEDQKDRTDLHPYGLQHVANRRYSCLRYCTPERLARSIRSHVRERQYNYGTCARDHYLGALRQAPLQASNIWNKGFYGIELRMGEWVWGSA